MRVADYLSHAWRGTVRQPVRTVLTVVALAVSATIVISLVSITVGAQRTITTERGLTEGLATMIVTPNSAVTTGMLGESVQVANSDAEKITDVEVGRIRAVSGVSEAVPLAAVPELRRFTVEGSPTSFVAAAVAAAAPAGHDLPLAAGRHPGDGRAGHAEVVLGRSYADALGVPADPGALVGRRLSVTTLPGYRGIGAKVPGPGSSLEQRRQFAEQPTTLTASVVGVSDDPRFKDRLLTSMSWAQAVRTPTIVKDGRLTAGPSGVAAAGYASVVVDADSPESVAAVSARIEALGFGVRSTQDQIERINRYVLIMWLVLGSVSLVSLLTAGLGIANTMLMTITEERHAINVWRVCGARRRTIRLLYLLQAAMLSLLGGALGMVAGYWLTWVLAGQIRRILQGRGMESITVAEATPQILLVGLLVTLGVGVSAAMYPAGRAARYEPGAFLSAQ